VSPNNLFIKSNEQKLFDLEFFCNETIPIGVYTGKIIVVSEEGLIKKIPVVFNVNEKDSLFDVIIYADKKKLKSGQELPFHLKLYNLGRTGIINASVEYYIKDFDGKIIIRKEENVSVDTNASLKNSIHIPKGLGIGKYVIGVNFRYDSFSGVSSDTFDVVRNWMYLYIILLILFILILIIVLYVIIRHHYRRKALKSLVRT
jgi:uncharacterized membrane protein